MNEKRLYTSIFLVSLVLLFSPLWLGGDQEEDTFEIELQDESTIHLKITGYPNLASFSQSFLDEVLSEFQKGIELIFDAEITEFSYDTFNNSTSFSIFLKGNFSKEIYMKEIPYHYTTYLPHGTRNFTVRVPSSMAIFSTTPASYIEGNMCSFVTYASNKEFRIQFDTVSEVKRRGVQNTLTYSQLMKAKATKLPVVLYSGHGKNPISKFLVPGYEMLTGSQAYNIANMYRPYFVRKWGTWSEYPDWVYYRVIRGDDPYSGIQDAILIMYYPFYCRQDGIPCAGVVHCNDHEPIFVWVRNIGEKPYKVAFDRWVVTKFHEYEILIDFDIDSSWRSYYTESNFWGHRSIQDVYTQHAAYFPQGRIYYNEYSHLWNGIDTDNPCDVFLDDMDEFPQNFVDTTHVKVRIGTCWQTYDLDINSNDGSENRNYTPVELSDNRLIDWYTSYACCTDMSICRFAHDISDPFHGLFWEVPNGCYPVFPELSVTIISVSYIDDTVMVNALVDYTNAENTDSMRGLWEDRFTAYIDGQYVGNPISLNENVSGSYTLQFSRMLSPGTHYMDLRVTDNLGKKSDWYYSYPFTVFNTPPQLSNGYVTPSSGDTSTTFDYYVDYYDANEDAPTTKYVYIDGTPHTMSLHSGSPNEGTYHYSRTLSVGSHNYYFYFSDGEDTIRLPPSESLPGPHVSSVPEPDFAISASPSTCTVSAGDSAHFTVTLTSENGFNGNVELTNSGLPPGATGYFNPDSVVPPSDSVFTIVTSSSTPAGTYTITITGTHEDKTHNIDVTLIVQSKSVQFKSYSVYDHFYGNDDGFVNPGEYIELIVYLENTGTEPVYGVEAIASTTSPYINPSDAYPSELNPYFGIISGRGISWGYMSFMVSSAPNGTVITFDLIITDSNDNTWHDSFDITITGSDTLPPRAITLQTSSQILSVGDTVDIVVFVEEGDDMSSGYVIAQIGDFTPLLFDDGLHNDYDAGDRYYGGSLTVLMSETDYLVSILTSDNSGNSAEWTDLAGFTTKTFTVSNKILVVDDDNHNLNSWVTAAPYQSYYTNALDANGLMYDVWECFFRGNPDSNILTQYDVVIWLTGDTYGESRFSQGYYTETLSSTDQTNLMNYLDNGGNLFISGQLIDYDMYWGDANDWTFYNNYLHADSTLNWTASYGLYGVAGDPMTDGLYLTISGGNGANNQLYPTEIDPINGAKTIFTYDPDATSGQQIQRREPLERELLEREQEIMQATSKNQLPEGIVSSGSGAISVDTGTYKVAYFAFGFEAIDNPADRNIILRKVTHWLQGTVEGSLPQLFNTNSYLVVGDDAYCTDVLGTAKISYGLALGGTSQNPEGRTHLVLTNTEHDTGNLIIVGGPAINPVAVEFDSLFGITYNHNPGVSFEIFYEGESIYLDLTQYPNQDICIVYLGDHNSRNAMLVWGYGWQGTYAGSAFMGDPANWQAYSGASMLMLRWTDSNGDDLVQKSEIAVESSKRPLTAKTVIRGVVSWLRGAADWVLSLLFNTNSYLVVGNEAYCTDVLGTAKISYGLAQGGASENPEGRTHTILTNTEHNTGNLIIVGGPAINPVAVEFDTYFNITYDHNPGVSFQINAEGESIYLNLANYPERDICIVYLAEHSGRNVLLVWGYGWYGSYAGSVFAGDPETWQTYSGAHIFMLRWIDSNGDGLVQKSEISVEAYA